MRKFRPLGTETKIYRKGNQFCADLLVRYADTGKTRAKLATLCADSLSDLEQQIKGAVNSEDYRQMLAKFRIYPERFTRRAIAAAEDQSKTTAIARHEQEIEKLRARLPNATPRLTETIIKRIAEHEADIKKMRPRRNPASPKAIHYRGYVLKPTESGEYHIFHKDDYAIKQGLFHAPIFNYTLPANSAKEWIDDWIAEKTDPRFRGKIGYTSNGVNKMSIKRNGKYIHNLESMVDSSSVRDLLEEIADICFEKAQHIRENWQDRVTAKTWDSDGNAIMKLAARMKN